MKGTVLCVCPRQRSRLSLNGSPELPTGLQAKAEPLSNRDKWESWICLDAGLLEHDIQSHRVGWSVDLCCLDPKRQRLWGVLSPLR